MTTQSEWDVVVIEDDPSSQLLISELLGNAGFRVRTAATGCEGARAVRAEPPSVITLDLELPDESGWQVLARLAADPDVAEVPVVIVSVRDPQGHPDLPASVRHWVMKPFRGADLVDAVRAVVEGAAA